MASTTSPKVSIVLPTHNRAATLQRAIESVFAQTFQAWELIILDDTSTDGTADILDVAARRDARVHVIENPSSDDFAKHGIVNILNQGLAIAQGTYIARIDDDDYWIDKQKLERQVAYLDAHPDCVVVGGGVVVVSRTGMELYRYLKKEDDLAIRNSALVANPFSHTTVMFRCDIAQAVGGYRTKYIEDWDLWLRMGLRGTFHNLQEYVTAYTMHGGNNSFIHQHAQSRQQLRSIVAHRREYPNFLWGYSVNLGQYLYTFLPIGIRKYFQARLSAVKRRM